MDALILAAGFGTRLYPLTHNIPKALIKLGNKPIIEHTLEKISNIPEIETIHILSNNKFYNHFTEWLNKLEHPIKEKIKILNNNVNHELESKGVLGDLKHVLNLTDHEELLVLGSDNLYYLDLGKVIEKGRKKQGSVNALKKMDKELIKIYGSALLDKNHKIINFEEKSQTPQSDLASIFCYYLTKPDLNKIKLHKPGEIKTIIELLYKNANFYGHPFTEPWFDIGSLEELKRAEKHLIDESKHL